MLKSVKQQVRGQLAHVVVKAPVMVSLDPVQVEKALDMAGLYSFDIDVNVDGKNYAVKCQDVQFHPVSDKAIHVDFLRK